MTRNSLFFLILLLLLNACGADGPFRGDCLRGDGGIVSEELSLDDFSGIDIVGSFGVVVKEGETQKVSVTGHANIISLLSREVREGIYRLRLESGCYDDFDLLVTVETPVLTQVTSSGSGDVFIESIATTETFTASTTGSGSISSSSQIESTDWVSIESTGSGSLDLSIDTDSLEVFQTGSGNITLSGQTRTQEVHKTGSGNYSAFGLTSDECYITNSGSGNSEVTVSTYLKAGLTGSGSVFYRGTPSIDSNVIGSGRVRAAN